VDSISACGKSCFQFWSLEYIEESKFMTSHELLSLATAKVRDEVGLMSTTTIQSNMLVEEQLFLMAFSDGD